MRRGSKPTGTIVGPPMAGRASVDRNLLIALLGFVGSLVAAYLAYRTATQANRISATKVDAEAYDRSVTFYEKVLADAEKQIERMRQQVDRLNDQLDRVNAQLATEQDLSNAARDQIRTLRTQVMTLETMLADLRSQLGQQQQHP